MASTEGVIVRATDVARVYPTGATAVSALDGVTLEVRRGEFLAVMGPSGSGKSTLLNILAGLERPTRGSVVVDGADLSAMDEVTLAGYRRDKVGMIFQAFNLLPRYRVIENVALPLVFAGVARETRLERARVVLDRLGMGPRADHRPSQLSGGEMQRTAIARALVTDPPLLLADEPTGNLDSANGEALLAVIAELHARGQTVVLVTHDAGIAVARAAGRADARRTDRELRSSDLFALAFGNYTRSRLRSTLTTLGVAIGTALVVLLIALATGAEDNVKRSIFSIGDLRLVTVQPFQPGATGLSAVPRMIGDDHVAKFKAIPYAQSVYRQYDAPLGTLLEGGEEAAIRPQGIEAGAPIDRGDLLAGRHLEPSERGVAVIPGNLARLVAPTPGAAVGKKVTLRLGGAVKLGNTRISGSGTPRDYVVTVVGVFDEQASQTSVRIPLEDALVAGAENRGLTADALRQSTGYSGVAIESEDSRYVADVVKSVQELGFSAFSLKQVIEQIDRGFGVFRGILAGIGGVALLVAAIGIANTMVMAVLERTREIGIMKAVGASPRDIRSLFLAEAALVGVFGGVIGLALGVLGGQVIELVIRNLNPQASPAPIFIVDLALALGAMGLALLVSLVAGFLPSRRAMRMSALSALRYE